MSLCRKYHDTVNVVNAFIVVVVNVVVNVVVDVVANVVMNAIMNVFNINML
jgi:hypothetical protein